VFGFAHRGSRRAVGAKLLVQWSLEVTSDGKDKLPVKLLACADRGCRLGVSGGCRPSQLPQGKAGGCQPSGFSLLLIMFYFCCQFLYITKGYIYIYIYISFRRFHKTTAIRDEDAREKHFIY
jgi:hypothetical protein